MAKYTPYCVTFYERGQVYFYDEIKDRIIEKVAVSSEEEALRLQKQWLDNAPSNVICQKI